jgi:integrase
MARTLSKFFGWCLQHRLITASPSVGVYVPPAPASRERVLTETEIVQFWNATDQMNEPFGAMLKLLLLTGARLREVAGMRRSEISGEAWTIPGTRTKNGKEHVVPLSPLACDILAKVKMIAGPGYVFTTTGTTPVSGFSKMKKQLDALIAETGVQKRTPEFAPWRLHDLRRTCATMMAESSPRGLGIAPHIVEACLNHISGHKVGVAGIYNKAEYLPEKTVALQRWGNWVEGLVAGHEPNITALPKLPPKGR